MENRKDIEGGRITKKIPLATPKKTEQKEQLEEQAVKDLNEMRESLVWLNGYLAKMNIGEYVSLMRKPWYVAQVNFLAGMARGIGFAVGFSILGAVIVLVLQKMQVLNIPLIGNFIAQILDYIKTTKGIY